ncbi:MAG TPA: hypothetical protein VHT49_09525 [Acidimicrobiales bacterium]|nr:hypothetical protein [Acidimicrobiales bacterium]
MLSSAEGGTHPHRNRGIAVTIVLIAALVAAITVGVVQLNQPAPGIQNAQEFTGRDVYSPDVHPNPTGSGYVMWYAGWQTQQTLDSGQLDTIYERTAPTRDGPWSPAATAIAATQVAPQITEVNDPSVTIVSENGSLAYTMFFTALACHPGAAGCATTAQQATYSQVWSGTSTDGAHWGSFRRLAVPDSGKGVSGPSAVLQPSGNQQWVVFYGTGCLIGMASVDASRQVLTSSIAYRGNGIACMSNPMVSSWGSKWHMLFNVLEPSATDTVRFDIWSTSSTSLTSWPATTPAPAVVVQGGHLCGALTPDVLPAGAGQFDIYFGLVTPGVTGACDDLTQSTSIARTRVPGSVLP